MMEPCERLQLGGAVVEIQDGNTGFRINANRGRAKLHFRPGILVSPQIVARCQRTIRDCLHPIAFAARLKRHRSDRITQPRHAAGRILRRPLRLRGLSLVLWALVLRRWPLVLLNLILRRLVLRRDSERCLQHEQYPRQDNSNCHDFERFHWLMFLAAVAKLHRFTVY